MLKIGQANFYRTEDNEQIFYLKNFSTPEMDKKTLVFNYGLVCSNLHWKYQVDYFDKLGHQILLHDYRGHFQSSGIHDVKKITFPQMAKDIKGLCDSLGIEKTIMLGHSMGVNVTLQVARDFPSLIQSMVLISGTFMSVHEVMFDSGIMEFITPFCVAGLKNYPEVVKKLWSSTGMNPVVKEIIHSTGFNKEKVSDEFIEIYLNRVAQLGPELFFQLFNEMTKQNIASDLEKINIPALIIGGHKDNVIPNHLQRTLAGLLPNSQSYFLLDGSHVPQVDFPELINERIELFLNQ